MKTRLHFLMTLLCAFGITLSSYSQCLDNFDNRLSSNLSYITNAIPNNYNFNYDGGSNYISDGGFDMYDGGNYLNTNLGSSFNYTSGAVVTNSGFGSGGRYVTSQLAGFFAMGAELNGVSTFSITGNLGADGQGAVTAHTFTTTVNGVSYSCYLKRVNDGSYDPAIHQVFIVPTTSGVSHSYSTYTDNNLHTLSGLSSVPYMYYILFAGRTSSNPYAYSIPNSNVEDITTKFLETVADTGLFLTNVSTTGGCPSQDSVQVAYNTCSAYFNSGNSITVQMSDTNGSFASPTTLGNWSTTQVQDTGVFTIPNVIAHTGYQIRLISSNPADTSIARNLGALVALPPSPNWIFATDTAICDADSVSFIDTLSPAIDSFAISLGYQELNGANLCAGQEYNCGSIAMTWTDTAYLVPTEVRFKIYSTLNCNGTTNVNFSLNGGTAEVEALNYSWCSCSTPTGGQMFSVTFDPDDYVVGGSNTITMTTSVNSCLGFSPSSALGGDIGQVYIVADSELDVEYSLSSSFNSILSQNDTFTTYVSSSTDYYYRSQNVYGCYSDTFETQTIHVSNLDLSASWANDVSCYGGNDGAITAFSTGGIGTVEYSVDGTNWQTSTSLTGLSAGSYVVYARDDESCMDSTTAIVVDEPTELVATIDSSQSASCADANDGYAYVSVTGGTAGYSYLWSNSSTTALNENLGVAEYIVVVTDGNDCETSDTIDIIFEDSIAPMVMVQNITAYLDSTGSVTITAAQIDNGSYDSCGIAQMIISDSVFSCNDTMNQVMLTIIDVNGNFASDTATVTVSDTIAPSIECPSPIEICEGVLALDNATSTDNCSSSTMHINGPVDGDTLEAGTYSSEFMAVDAFGNESTCSVDITVNPLPVIELGNDSIFCDSIEFTLDAGNTGSSFDWSTGESSQTILVTDSGNYQVTVTDENGCESTSSIHVGLKVCVGIDEVGNPIYMTVYPNPATSSINVQIDGFANEVQFDILDINGKLIESKNRNDVSASSIEVIDISSYSAGIYILSVKVNDKTYVQRISKM